MTNTRKKQFPKDTLTYEKLEIIDDEPLSAAELKVIKRSREDFAKGAFEELSVINW